MLGIIDGAQRAGFSLEQIRQWLPLGDGRWNHEQLLAALKAKVTDIEAVQKRLKQNKAQLLAAIDSIERRPDGIACVDNQTRVLDQLRGRGVVSSRHRPARAG